MHILALEASTSSAKAMYYNTDDDTYEVTTKSYTGNYDDVSILKADNVYLQMMETGRELLAGREADIISLGGSWHTVGLFNRDFTPASPVYQWTFTGASDICRELRKDPVYVSEYYGRTGCMVNAIYPFFILKYLSGVYDLSHYYIMGQGTYNNLRITGERVTCDAILSGSGLLNEFTREFDADLLAELGVKREQLAKVVSYRETFPIIPEAAKLLGVEPGIPVVLSCADGALNQTGAGALASGVMTFSVGTSGAIRLSTDAPLLTENGRTWCYASPTAWLSGAATNGCTSCIDWFRKAAFSPETSYAEIEAGIRDYETTPVFLPFIFGERCPGWDDERRGGFMNLRPSHTRYDMYRAVQEGVLFNLYHCYRILTDVNGEPEHIRLSGGILYSEAWTQMCADIFQREMEIDENQQSSLSGGVALAKERLGIIDDIRNYRPEPAGIIRPNPCKAPLYEDKFERYLKCYNEGA